MRVALLMYHDGPERPAKVTHRTSTTVRQAMLQRLA